VLVGVATVGRLWCSRYISGYKNFELIISGPYSVTRNPLYFFSFLVFTGIGLSTESVTFTLGLVLAFALVYPVIIRREERFLQDKFGRAFSDYCARTPRFFPTSALFMSRSDTWSIHGSSGTRWGTFSGSSGWSE